VISTAAVAAVVRRPGLWGTALRQAAVLAAPGWWRRPPFLPVPPPDYLRFRLQTAYGGDGSGPIEPDDLVTYLAWCKAWRRRPSGPVRESTTATRPVPVP
jgi:hypothetical protein